MKLTILPFALCSALMFAGELGGEEYKSAKVVKIGGKLLITLKVGKQK